MITQKRFVIAAMFKTLKILRICLILLALLAPTAHAETKVVNPGNVGGEAQDFQFDASTQVVDIVWADNKTLEWGAGTHIFFLLGPPGSGYVGILLDAAGIPIPGTELIGTTPTSGDPGKAGVINLAETTVFSGIRLISGDFFDEGFSTGWVWNWRDNDRPLVGQTEASGNQPPLANAGAPVTGQVGIAVAFDGSGSIDPDGTIAQYDWDFVETLANNAGPTPSHIFTASGTYNVTLTVTDNDGLTNTDNVTATIAANSHPPTAEAGGPYTGTEGVAVSFDGSLSSDPEGPIAQYDWDFGDNTIVIDAGAIPTHTYASSGEYTVVLTVTDSDAETDDDHATATITIGHQAPEADAGPPAVGTAGVAVSFDGSGSSDPDGPIAQYDWDFGDGNSLFDGGPTPSHVYTAPGDYTVYLAVTDGDGAQDTAETAASIDSDPLPPRADAGKPYDGITGLDVTFNGSRSFDLDGTIDQYDWDFGDNTTGNGEIVDHTYAAPGSYRVTLQVTDNDGLTDTNSSRAEIADGNEPPTAYAGQGQEGKVEQPFTFNGSGSVDRDGTVASYDWDFGDGNTGTGENPIHTYTVAGDYLVFLTVTDDDGATDSDSTTATVYANNLPPVSDAGGPYTGNVNVAVNFDGTVSADSDGTIVQYDWDYGDGNSAVNAGAVPTHTYTVAGTYDVSLTVTDNGGDTNSSWTTAAIDSSNVPPMADAGGPYGHKVDVPVHFDGSGSSDPDGTIDQYDWDFGDNNTATDAGPMPSHTYAAPGVYDVVLTVTDNNGDTAKSATKALIADIGNLPPTADPGGPYARDQGVAVHFNGVGSSDPDGSIVQYDWDFGDGNTAINGGPTPSHAYSVTVVGAYLVTLTVTDDGGATNTRTTVAAIGLDNREPSSDAGGPYGGAVGVPVLFNGSASSDPDGSIGRYDWDFGDGNTGSGLFSTHTYTAPGAYTARLTVTDNRGASNQSTASVIVGDGAKLPPRADANGPYNGVIGVPLTLDGSKSTDPDGDITAWDWDFGDGDITVMGMGLFPASVGTGPTVDNSYLAGGLYSVILQVTDDDGLSASDSSTARIGDLSLPPTANASGPYKGRVGVPVAFDGSDSSDPDGDITRYDWDFGDGNIANDAGATPTNVYATGGKYIARLTVTDDSGETDTDITIVNVGIGNLTPQADAGGVVSGKVGRAITFDGTASRDPDGSVANYAWSFGDGNTGTGPNPTHSYAAAGKYFVTLSVTDNDGTVSSDATLAEAEPVSVGGGGGGSGGVCFITTAMGQ